MDRIATKNHLLNLLVFSFVVSLLVYWEPCFAQSGLEGRITTTIYLLIRIVNILIVGFVVWAGFLIARGEQSGFHRLIYGVVGLIVANTAYMIINYFT
jgi:hypothetical protein